MPERTPPSAARLGTLLGWTPAAPEPPEGLGGGRNSRVYRLCGPEGQEVALKLYFRHPEDTRDRLGTERAALDFCWSQGLRCVPRPLAADPEAGFALYEWIAGTPVSAPGPEEVDQAVDFLVQLHCLGGRSGARHLPSASEACFSLAALAAHIQARLAPLSRAAEDSAPLRDFLANELAPAYEVLLDQCRESCRTTGVPFEAELPQAARTLSPSDFGFHNALRRDERLVFLDFEYFGWDDPAKTVADLLLHPGMELAPELRGRFARGVLRGLEAIPGLALRTRLAFPLYGIKWCLILLNEFLPGPLERRTFADPGRSREERQARQLLKAQRKLGQLLDEHADFPHFRLPFPA